MNRVELIDGVRGALSTSRLVVCCCLMFGSTFAAHAATVPEVLDAGNQWLVAQSSSQDRVDDLGEERRSLADEYRTVLREIEGLEAYNRQLERQLRLQGEEVAILDESIAQATTVDRQILPLMLRMVDALEQFIALDIPFLPRERAERLQFVMEAIDRVDVTVAEKFRQVLEAYLIELEFGRTIEAYTGTVDVDGQKLEVDFLRVGRIGLYYQTLDGTQSARWDAASKRWENLPASDRNPVRDAIRVARKLTAPNLLTLPLPTAGDAS
jgi:hypothetical protein